MNRVILCGRLVRDPEIRYAQGESAMAIARYTIAVDRRGKKDQTNNGPSADFINCVAFGKSAEFAEKYFSKGLRVLVSGRIQTGSYTNRDGQKVYTTDVLIEEQEFADGKQTAQTNQPSTGGQSQGSPIGDGFMHLPDNLEDDGLPFD